MVAKIVNTYRMPIKFLLSSLATVLPESSGFFGPQLIVADGKDFNDAASKQIIADVLEMESVPKQTISVLLYQDTGRKDFVALKAAINAGEK